MKLLQELNWIRKGLLEKNQLSFRFKGSKKRKIVIIPGYLLLGGGSFEIKGLNEEYVLIWKDLAGKEQELDEFTHVDDAQNALKKVEGIIINPYKSIKRGVIAACIIFLFTGFPGCGEKRVSRSSDGPVKMGLSQDEQLIKQYREEMKKRQSAVQQAEQENKVDGKAIKPSDNEQDDPINLLKGK